MHNAHDNEKASVKADVIIKAGLFVLVGLAFGVMFWRSWLQWPDVLVDSGRELYVPWQMTQGKVLYHDIASFYGPWSSGFNALIFKIAGVGLAQLFVANALVLLAATWLLYWLGRQVAGAVAATTGVLVFILLMAFGQYFWIGGNNWMLPYAHELTHGVTLCLAGVACVLKFASTRQRRWVFAAGVCLGVTMMTKPEPAFALACTQVVLLGLLWLRGRHADATQLKNLRFRLCHALCWLAGVLLPLLAMTLIFWRDVSLPQAMGATLGAWQFVVNQMQGSQRYHMVLMGMDKPWVQLARLMCWAVGIGSLLGVSWLIGLYVPKLASGKSDDLRRVNMMGGWAILAVLVVGGVLMWAAIHQRWIHWSGFAFVLPLLMAVLFGRSLWAYVRSGDVSLKWFAMAGLSLLSLLLLVRILLNVNVTYYGPFLAAPGMVLAVSYCVGPWAEGLKKRGGSPWPVRGMATVMLAGLLYVFMSAAGHFERQNTTVVGESVDRFYTTAERGDAVNAIMGYVREHAAPGDTLVVMPEGIMLNYLLRMPSSVSYVNFMPVEFSMYGEERMLDAVKRSPPRFIALVDKDTSEYGPQYFGRDYGVLMMSWMKKAYEPAVLAGHPPFSGQGFGILLVERRDRASLTK